ncbi:MAG: glycosyltransferase family 2 protein [Halocynthiibacter sp.]
MEHPSVSLVIVSYNRPDDLAICLTGVAQLYYPNFEIIVVTDPHSAKVAADHAQANQIKRIEIADANISAARNAGIRASAGDYIAFLDDDAVPEPTWLSTLMEGLLHHEADCATGFVRGRNGVSFQWKAETIDAEGTSHPLTVPEDVASCPMAPNGQAIKTVGTNCIFREDILRQVGGFDPRYHYYLDDGDLNMRLAKQGVKTAIVPQAQVQHGFRASHHRNASRAPKSLFDIGCSLFVYLDTYCAPEIIPTALHSARAHQHNRIISMMCDGRLEPSTVAPLLESFDRGVAEAQSRIHEPCTENVAPTSAFHHFQTPYASPKMTWHKGRTFAINRTKARALERLRAHHRATVFAFSFTSYAATVTFHKDGYWLHRGGVFGRKKRTEPFFQISTFRKRCQYEENTFRNVR